MSAAEFEGKWEQRWHPLQREWIVYAGHRNTRPWDGAHAPDKKEKPAYDPSCYLCPGNKRIHGEVNPDYRDVFIFDNDHPVVGMDAPDKPEQDTRSIYRKAPASGIARVICYHPNHSVNLNTLPLEKIAGVMQAWKQQTLEFIKNPDIKGLLIFENRGEITGTSNPHPHGQIYATRFVFQNIKRELEAAQDFYNDQKTDLFQKIIDEEITEGTRIIAQNDHAVAILPFFARYPFECWIFPKKANATLGSMNDAEIEGLAEVYRQLTLKFDGLYQMDFPYVMSIYQAPMDQPDMKNYRFHLIFLPPLRQPGIQKFPAGPEIGGGNFMADTIPEEKAAELNAVKIQGTP